MQQATSSISQEKKMYPVLLNSMLNVPKFGTHILLFYNGIEFCNKLFILYRSVS